MKYKILPDEQNENQAFSMSKFVKRVNFLFGFSIIAVIIVVFFIVFLPMKVALEKSLIENFAQISYTNYHAFENSIQRGIEGAKSLSSRTMIRNAIGDYKSGKMNLKQLEDFTQEKYEDGAKAIDNLLFAERIVDEKVIAKYSATNNKVNTQLFEIEKESNLECVSKIIVNEESISAIIVSPIIIDNKVAGYDKIVYGLDKQLDLLCTKTISANLMSQNDYESFTEKVKAVRKIDKIDVFESIEYYFAITNIQEDMYFISKQKKDSLLEPISQLAIRIITGGSLAFIFFAIIVYFYIVRFAKKELGNLETSRNAFKKIAYIDHLTGAYSRQFLDIWNKNIRSHKTKYAVVMIDVDDFKNINDIYGHAIGDKVLRQLSVAIMKSIRQSDMLIRYGGDEFVLILSDVEVDGANDLIGRIKGQMKIAVDSSIEIEIQISYGISLLTGDNDLEELLKDADSKMYECKNCKKTEKHKRVIT